MFKSNKSFIAVVAAFVLIVSPLVSSIVWVFMLAFSDLSVGYGFDLAYPDVFPNLMASNVFSGIMQGLIALALPVMLRTLFSSRLGASRIFFICVMLYLLLPLSGLLFGASGPDIFFIQTAPFISLIILTALALVLLKRFRPQVFAVPAELDAEGGKRPILSLQEELTRNMEQEIPKNRAIAILDLRARADKLLKVSYLVLFTTVVVLGFAAVFIVFAGEITKLGTQPADPLRMAESTLAGLTSELKEADERYLAAAAQLTRLDDSTAAANAADAGIAAGSGSAGGTAGASAAGSAAPAAPPAVSPARDRALIDRTISAAAEPLPASRAGLMTWLDFYQQKRLNLNQRIGQTSDELKNLREKVFEQNKDGMQITDPSLLMTITVTRFGVLAIAIYLVQILINLYRYNTRLVAHYRGTADALLLLDHRHDRIENLHRSLWPDLDYGKQPKTLPEQLTDRFGSLSQTALELAARRLSLGTQSITGKVSGG